MENKPAESASTYSIVRYYKKSGRRKVLHGSVSLEVAQLHCNDPRTSTDKWFDGYRRN